MIIALFRRRLKEGLTYSDFEDAWRAEQGFGVPARVITAVNLSDEREVLTVGFVDLTPEQLAAGAEAVAEQEAKRHSKIDEVIESTELRAFYEVEGEFDFSAAPREIEARSAGSLFANLRDG
jgi:hypothetical protein